MKQKSYFEKPCPTCKAIHWKSWLKRMWKEGKKKSTDWREDKFQVNREKGSRKKERQTRKQREEERNGCVFICIYYNIVTDINSLLKTSLRL
jgi:hypothetical protein